MAQNSTNCRGSIWRKWDIHVHTPASYDWGGGNVSADDIIDAVQRAGLDVVAVTDHHTITWIDQMRAAGKKRGITVLPGVELRTDKGNKGIHIISIFEEGTQSKIIYDKLLAPIGFSDGDVKDGGNEQVYCDFEEACKKTKELGGLIFLHAGGKSCGIEQLDSDARSLLKKDMASLVDVLEVSDKAQADDYRAKVFPDVGRAWPIIVTSDSVDRSTLGNKKGHSPELIGKKFAWIKADATFLGLTQVINEPGDRAFVGTIPLKLSEANNNKSRYIDSIKIANTNPSATPTWFNDELPLNSGLVAIIGRKGSGKSALADIISLCGDSKINPTDYSFLKKDKFRKRGLAQSYEAKLTWLDGKSTGKNLNEDVYVATTIEKVKYLPQQYVETICNEDGVSTLFQQEIDKVIFSYVPEENRLNSNSLNELIRVKTESVDSSLAASRAGLRKVNEHITALEDKELPQYLESLNKKLEGKQRELNSLEKPEAIKKPNITLSDAKENKIKKLNTAISKIDGQISTTRDELKDIIGKLHKLNQIDAKLTSLKDNVAQLFESLNDDATELSINLSKVIKLTISDSVLTRRKDELTAKKNKLDAKLEPNNPKSKTSLYNKKATLTAELEQITTTLDAGQKQYKEHQKELGEYEEKKKAITGKQGDTNIDTIAGLKAEIDFVKNKLNHVLQETYKKRGDILQKLFDELGKKIDFYQEVYTPLVKFIKSEEETQKKSGSILGFSAGLTFGRQKFVSDFFSFINQNRDGSFQTIAGGEKILNGLVEKYGFTKKDDVVKFVEDVLDHLRNDKTKSTPEKNHIKFQLKKDQTAFYDFLFGLSYLDVKYKILFNGKDLNANEFSPGEKGALLLIFYLLIDKDNIPLVIDQPEENLDNESVYTLLVPYIKKAKSRRQIVAVTHNPNLAVVCDAEQVIYASMDKKNNEIRYIAGSIEDPVINKRIVDVLEGTLPAFTVRDKKYIRKKK